MTNTCIDVGMTNLTVAESKTVETDKTYSILNDEFMSVVFGDAVNDARPIVASFFGHPNDPPYGGYTGKPWHGKGDELAHLPQHANNFFTLARCAPDEAGKYRRQKKRFSSFHALMLDDVGANITASKAPLSALLLPPSWLIETSSENYQAGYLLRDPITDPKEANHLLDTLVAKVGSDSGARSAETRIARLPVGANGKHSPVFQSRLVQWNPDLRYSIQELVDGFELELKPLAQLKRVPVHYSSNGNQLLTLPQSQNAVLAELEKRGLLKSDLGNGKYDMTCPWVQEHTNGADGGTAYFEPDMAFSLGGFKCLHGHCDERHLLDLLKELGLSEADARIKATIHIEPGQLHAVVDAAERVLAASGDYFQSGHRIVEVVTEPGTGQVCIRPIEMSDLTKVLSAKVDWLKIDGRSKQWCQIDPPQRALSILHESRTLKHLPVLKGLANQPYLHPDFSIVMQSGYDSKLCIYGVFDREDFKILESPTREDAINALQELNELLTEFCFVDEWDRAAALSSMITAVLRPGLPHAPMFHARAPVPSSGKSTLMSVVSSLATAQISAPMSFTSHEVEFQKKFFSELLLSPAVVLFDNLTTDLVPHNCLCSALTSEYISDRILGSSKNITVGTRTLMLSNGNNVGPIRDMARRTITINLDPRCELPAAREYARPDLLGEVRRSRSRYVSAVLTIVKAWIIAEKPMTHCKPFAGFEVWSQLCRQPLLWLGLPDPIQSTISAMEEDPDRVMLKRFHLLWQYQFGQYEGTVQKLVNPSLPLDEDVLELREVLFDIAGDRDGLNRRRLGWWIKRHAGQIVDDMFLEKGTSKRSAEVWRLTKRE